MLNYVLTPLVTYVLHTKKGQAEFGEYSMFLSAISFLNVVYSYGMETGYFRFSSNGSDKRKLFQTAFGSILVSTIVFSAVLFGFRQYFADYLKLGNHPEYIIWCIGVVAIDALSIIPFARLRQEERPRKYAFTKVAGIFVNILLTIFFIYYSPVYVLSHPTSAYTQWYHQYTGPGFLILSLLAQAAVTFLLLYKEWGSFRFQFDGDLWKKIIVYASPMIIIGLGGMVNETFDRIMLGRMFVGTDEAAKQAVGIYSGNYKIAIFITLFVQAFKMSAEPFFFSQSGDKNAPKTYARVLKWFVITLCVAFLFSSLYLDIWKHFNPESYWSGLGVVPILLAANIALGIYYNLSVWYKITDRMRMGIYITLMGATITLIINYAFIPRFGMYACAWATLAAYGTMMVVSYILGQKYFPVPYARKKLMNYMVVMFLLYFVQQGIGHFTENLIIRLLSATFLMLLFLRLVAEVEKKELVGMPVIGKYLK